MNPQNTPLAYFFHAAGPAADPVIRLGWGLAAISIAVVVIIAGLLLAAIFRKRAGTPRKGSDNDAGSQLVSAGDRDGMAWVYIGTGVSAVVLFASAVWALVTLSAIAAPAATPRVTVEVRGYQYWWRVRYLDANGGVLLTTANEIHIPVGEPIRFQLSSGDVIHSFWVPQLGGKMDAVPGQTNVTWLQADRAGRYRGQCGEYCGLQHAHMALFVEAESPEEFANWLAHQRSDATPSANGAQAASGEHLFDEKCAGCHAVRGTAAKGMLAPDLTHLMTRETIAAGVLPNTEETLRRWIAHTQEVKPGSEMPVVTLQPAELDAVVGSLGALR